MRTRRESLRKRADRDPAPELRLSFVGDAGPTPDPIRFAASPLGTSRSVAVLDARFGPAGIEPWLNLYAAIATKAGTLKAWAPASEKEERYLERQVLREQRRLRRRQGQVQHDRLRELGDARRLRHVRRKALIAMGVYPTAAMEMA